MKILYIISLSSDVLDGIGNKVVGQITTWEKLGEDVKILAYSPIMGDALLSVPGWNFSMSNPLGFAVFGKVKRLVQYLRGLVIILVWRPDIIYVRAEYRPFGCGLWRFLGANVVCEINSDIENQIVADLKSGVIDDREGRRRIEHWKDSLAHCDGVVSVSYQMEEVNKKFFGDTPHAVVWNSIEFNSSTDEERMNRNNALPRLCFIGSADFSWNGVDLLRSFATETIGKLEFVVIGVHDGYDFPSNVKVYPYLEHSMMIEVLNECDIGLGTLALFRKGLNECSTLKVRDYAVMGMPMILSYKETAFVGEILPEWILEIKNEEGSLLMNKSRIISFATRWRRKAFNHKKASKYFDSLIVESRRVGFFKEVCKTAWDV